MSERIVPVDQQVCIVRLKNGEEHYAIWTMNYSIYGAGGHFSFADGGMAGIPHDIDKWWGTHWLAVETPDIAKAGQ